MSYGDETTNSNLTTVRLLSDHLNSNSTVSSMPVSYVIIDRPVM